MFTAFFIVTFIAGFFFGIIATASVAVFMVVRKEKQEYKLKKNPDILDYSQLDR